MRTSAVPLRRAFIQRRVDNSKMEQEYFKVKAGLRNSAAASFCVGTLEGFMTWVKYENENHSSDRFRAFCDALTQQTSKLNHQEGAMYAK